MQKQLLQVVATVALLGAAPAFAQNAAIVNGKPVPKARVDALLKQVEKQAGQTGRQVPAGLADQVREEVINREVLIQEAQKQGLDKTPDYQAQVDNAKQIILINALRTNFDKNNPVSDQELKTVYDKLVAENSGKEYKARHILVATEDEAKKVLADLNKGAKFEDLAKKLSKDSGSGAKGGDLDWSNPSGLVPEFSQAMMKLKKGETTAAPVKTEFGWHIIRLDDVRDQTFPKLEEIKPQLSQQVQQRKLQEYQDNLRAKAKIQ